MTNIQELVGKTIKAIDYPGKYDNIIIQFTDLFGVRSRVTTENTKMITEEDIQEKIISIINENDITDAAEAILLIMKELAVIPQSVDVMGSIDRTIDMVCEENFG